MIHKCTSLSQNKTPSAFSSFLLHPEIWRSW